MSLPVIKNCYSTIIMKDCKKIDKSLIYSSNHSKEKTCIVIDNASCIPFSSAVAPRLQPQTPCLFTSVPEFMYNVPCEPKASRGWETLQSFQFPIFTVTQDVPRIRRSVVRKAASISWISMLDSPSTNLSHHTLSAFRPLSRVLRKRPSPRAALRDLILPARFPSYLAAEKSRL